MKLFYRVTGTGRVWFWWGVYDYIWNIATNDGQGEFLVSVTRITTL